MTAPAELVEAMAREIDPEAFESTDGEPRIVQVRAGTRQRAAADRARACLQSLSQAGWVVVRREPSEGMLRAWYETQCPPFATPAGGATRWATWEEAKPTRGEEMAKCYRAMLSAGEE